MTWLDEVHKLFIGIGYIRYACTHDFGLPSLHCVNHMWALDLLLDGFPCVGYCAHGRVLLCKSLLVQPPPHFKPLCYT